MVLTTLVPYNVVLDVLIICMFNPFSFMLSSELQ